MRILLCNFEYPPLGGGGGVISALLAQELAKRHQVTVLTSQALGMPRRSCQNGLTIVRVPVFLRRQEAVGNLLSMAAFIPIGILAGKRLLRESGYDLINTHFALPSGPVGDALARFGQIPNVLTLHGGDLYDPSKFTSPHRHLLLRMWIRRLLGRADMIVADSSNNLDNMRRFYAPEVDAVRIPLGIPRPAIEVASRCSYGLAEDEVVVVTVGRLVPRKAIIQLITMMEALRGERVSLLIIGTGPQASLLQAETLRRRLDKRIRFLGHLEESEKVRILQMCDIYVSTSQHEGFGLVFLEAMACGLPIVCYDHGGQTDFLEDGATGHLVPLNDLDLFIQRCRSLIRSPGLRKIMGDKNRLRTEDYYIDICSLRYEKVFSDVLRAHPNGKRAILMRSHVG